MRQLQPEDYHDFVLFLQMTALPGAGHHLHPADDPPLHGGRQEGSAGTLQCTRYRRY